MSSGAPAWLKLWEKTINVLETQFASTETTDFYLYARRRFTASNAAFQINQSPSGLAADFKET